MQAFRVIYALHFALGVLVALQLWPFTMTVFGLVSDLDITFRDVFTGTSISGLAILWYFVWYGSISFAIRGRFPIVSIRPFAAMLAIVYLGAGMLSCFIHGETIPQLAANRPALLVAILVMLTVASASAVMLPRVKQNWDAERQRLDRMRDEQLDQMYRISNPRIRP